MTEKGNNPSNFEVFKLHKNHEGDWSAITASGRRRIVKPTTVNFVPGVGYINREGKLMFLATPDLQKTEITRPGVGEPPPKKSWKEWEEYTIKADIDPGSA